MFQGSTNDAAAGHTSAYDLRHTFASLLFRDGSHSNAKIAAMLGHSVETLLRVYVHVIEELHGTERLPANEQIRAARPDRAPRISPASPRGPQIPPTNASDCPIPESPLWR